MCKGITLLKNDFLVKPELSASRVLLSLPQAAVNAPVAGAPVALPAEEEGHIRTYRCIGYIKVLIRHKGCYIYTRNRLYNDVYNTRSSFINVVISL